MGRIRIVGYASPEGGYGLNQRLARARAESLADYLRAQIAIPDSLLSIEDTGINWLGLYRAVEESSMSNKARVQYIIKNEPEQTFDAHGTLTDSRTHQLKRLDNGRTWAWMMQNLYPSLRSSAALVCCIQHRHIEQPQDTTTLIDNEIEDDTLVVTETVQTEVETEPEVVGVDTIAIQITPEERFRYPIFALRSNLLLPLLNVGVEMPIGNRWSVGLDYYYPWSWRKDDHKNCFELIFLSAEARYWFGSKHTSSPENRACRLTGHSAAVYGAWGYYDIERNYHGHQGHGYSAGVDYTYAMPISKNRLRLEFQAALGVMYTQAQPYDVKEVGGRLIRERGKKKDFTYFGPTKIAVSLVVPLFKTEKRVANTAEP